MTDTSQPYPGRPSRRSRSPAAVLFGLAVALAAPVADAATLVPVSSFGANPGDLLMYEYVPERLPAGAPLVVVLHGCSQAAQPFLDSTGWAKIADESGFALIAAEQKEANHPQRCFNWYLPDDTGRGQGEAQSIASMVEHAALQHGLDKKRVYVTGLSAGGAMTAVMLATYPDLFAGGAVMAGLPYRCAGDLPSALACMRGAIKDAPAWGELVRAAGSHSGSWPILSVWHGEGDTIVSAKNLAELVKQWADVHGMDQKADATARFGGAVRKQYKNKRGAVVIETWSFKGMGHAAAVNPGKAANQCGIVSTFFHDADVCASYYAARHWGIIKPVKAGAGKRRR